MLSPLVRTYTSPPALQPIHSGAPYKVLVETEVRVVATGHPLAQRFKGDTRSSLRIILILSCSSFPRRPAIATVNPTKIAIHSVIRHQTSSEGEISGGITNRSIIPSAPGIPMRRASRTIHLVERGRVGIRRASRLPIPRIVTAASTPAIGDATAQYKTNRRLLVSPVRAASTPAIGDATAQYKTNRRLLVSPVRAGKTTTDHMNSNTLSDRASTSVHHNFPEFLAICLNVHVRDHPFALGQRSPNSNRTGLGVAPPRSHLNQFMIVHSVDAQLPSTKKKL